MKRLPSLALRIALSAALFTGCSNRTSPAREQQSTSSSASVNKDKAQARGFANANAMMESASLCEPKAGEPSVVACQRACELNHSNSCANWAALLDPSEESAVLALYQRACKGGSGIGCEGNARIVERAGGNEGPVYRNARRYHRIHCDQGYARSCEQLAALLETTKGGKPVPEAATTFRSKACSLGRVSSCER